MGRFRSAFAVVVIVAQMRHAEIYERSERGANRRARPQPPCFRLSKVAPLAVVRTHAQRGREMLPRFGQ